MSRVNLPGYCLSKCLCDHVPGKKLMVAIYDHVWTRAAYPTSVYVLREQWMF
jgi:hypothetical protein